MTALRSSQILKSLNKGAAKTLFLLWILCESHLFLCTSLNLLYSILTIIYPQYVRQLTTHSLPKITPNTSQTTNRKFVNANRLSCSFHFDSTVTKLLRLWYKNYLGFKNQMWNILLIGLLSEMSVVRSKRKCGLHIFLKISLYFLNFFFSVDRSIEF